MTAGYPEGYIDVLEARLLENLAGSLDPPGLILEIGSYKGMSTVALGRGALKSGSRVIAIDHGDGSPEWPGDHSGYFPELIRNLQAYGVAEVVEVRQQYSQVAAAQWSDPLALLWIDGGHEFAQVRGDCVGFKPFVRKGGIVAIHDYHDPGWPDVKRAVDLVFPNWEATQIATCLKTIAFRMPLRKKAMKKPEPIDLEGLTPCGECGSKPIALCLCRGARHGLCEQGHIYDVNTGDLTPDAHKRIKF